MFLLFNAIPRYEPFLEKENARLYNVFEEFGADFFDKSIATWNVLGCMNDDRKAMEEIAKVTRTKFFFSCLAKGTLSERMKYYENLKLKRIEKAEDLLLAMGFKQLRVRHHGETARIELGQNEMSGFTPNIEGIVKEKFQELGFQSVYLDPKGYRMGSLNEALKEKTDYV